MANGNKFTIRFCLLWKMFRITVRVSLFGKFDAHGNEIINCCWCSIFDCFSPFFSPPPIKTKIFWSKREEFYTFTAKKSVHWIGFTIVKLLWIKLRHSLLKMSTMEATAMNQLKRKFTQKKWKYFSSVARVFNVIFKHTSIQQRDCSANFVIGTYETFTVDLENHPP